MVPGEGPQPLAAAALTGGAGADAAATRSAAVAGVMLGVLAAASGLAWALYKFKPGVIPLGGAAAGGARAGAPSAASPLLGSAGTGAADANAKAAVTAATAPPADGKAEALATTDVGTMAAAGYSSAGASGAGGAYARGFGVADSTSRTLTLTDQMVGAGASRSPSSTMNRGIQTDVANGPMSGAGLAAAGGGASSSMYTESTMVKNVYSTQQAGSSFVDGLVVL